MTVEVVIIGAGVVGCAVARELAVRGAQVTVIESRDQVASEATRGSGGILAYSPTRPRPPEWHALASRSLKAHRELARTLAGELDDAPSWSWCGRLDVCLSDEDESLARAQYQADRAKGSELRWLTGEEIAQLEPELEPTVRCGFINPDAGWVDPVALTQAFCRVARAHGANFVFAAEDAQLIYDGDRVVGVRASATEYRAEHTIIAAGAWSSQFAHRGQISVVPVRGQTAVVAFDGPCPIQHIIYSGQSHYLVPRERALFIGASREEVGFCRETTVGAVTGLVARATQLLGAVKNRRWDDIRTNYGFRPKSPSLQPAIGPDPLHRGLLWATGHFANGILLAPITATLLADVVVAGRHSQLLTTLQ